MSPISKRTGERYSSASLTSSNTPYSKVRNMSTSNWETWFTNAREHLEMAESALNAGLDELAYEKAVYSGECALKSVLVKHDVFTRLDWTHDQRETRG